MITKPGLLCAFLAAATALAETAPDAAEQSRALAAIRDYALNYAARLPDFTCIQVTRRTYYPNAALRHPRYDYIEEQITFVDHKENYTVTKINGEAVGNTERNQLGGIISSGEFGTLLSRTFDPGAGTDFRWDRWATQQGRKVYVFAFRVPPAKGYGLVESKRTILVAYKGLLYADPQTGAVLRVEMQCEIPKDSEYKELELILDFKPADVAGREFVLPFHYRLHSYKLVSGGAARVVMSETLNEADFKAYRRFGADISITFDKEK
jgi:hypothetical protein